VRSGIQPFPIVPSAFFVFNRRKQKWVQTSLKDGNLIRVALECRDVGGLAYPYHGALGQKAYLPR
jgi:hypothetical protein